MGFLIIDLAIQMLLKMNPSVFLVFLQVGCASWGAKSVSGQEKKCYVAQDGGRRVGMGKKLGEEGWGVRESHLPPSGKEMGTIWLLILASNHK